MVLKIISNKNIWDEFVDINKTSQLYHTWDFLQIIAKYSKFQLITYGIFNNEELICIFPLFYKKIFFFKMIFSPPPSTGIPYLGLVIFDKYYNLKQNKKEEFLKLISEDVILCINNFHPDYCLISLMPEIYDVRYFKFNKYKIEVNYTYKLELNTIDNIWNNFTKDLRKKINDTLKLNINFYETDDVTIVYDMISKRYEEKGLNIPLLGKSYLNDIKATFPNNIIINIAKYNSEIIGSELIIRYKKTHFDWIGGTKPSKKISLNELFIWRSIKKGIENNLSWFDFIGANTMGIFNFKSQFNPRLVQYFVIKKENWIGKIANLLYIIFYRKKWYIQ